MSKYDRLQALTQDIQTLRARMQAEPWCIPRLITRRKGVPKATHQKRINRLLKLESAQRELLRALIGPGQAAGS